MNDFLLAGRGLLDAEPLTLQWYAVKYTEESYASQPTFAIFDTFETNEGRTAHLTGETSSKVHDVTVAQSESRTKER